MKCIRYNKTYTIVAANYEVFICYPAKHVLKIFCNPHLEALLLANIIIIRLLRVLEH